MMTPPPKAKIEAPGQEAFAHIPPPERPMTALGYGPSAPASTRGGRHRGWRTAALLVAAVAFAAPAAAQQTGRIAGRVTDATSGAALGEVQVYIPGTGLGTLTRSTGQFL